MAIMVHFLKKEGRRKKNHQDSSWLQDGTSRILHENEFSKFWKIITHEDNTRSMHRILLNQICT